MNLRILLTFTFVFAQLLFYGAICTDNHADFQKKWNQIPKIHFVKDANGDEPIVIDGVEINDEFIAKLESYVQEELEMLEKPTILH